jgi:putative transposase
MWQANPTWGSIRIRDERAKLGFRVSDSTIRKYRPKSPPRPSQTWRSFLNNHLSEIAAMDFFVVPTATFRVLYVLVVLAHERRKVVHLSVTESPTAAWTAQQILNASLQISGPSSAREIPDTVFATHTRSAPEDPGASSPSLAL